MNKRLPNKLRHTLRHLKIEIAKSENEEKMERGSRLRNWGCKVEIESGVSEVKKCGQKVQ